MARKNYRLFSMTCAALLAGCLTAFGQTTPTPGAANPPAATPQSPAPATPQATPQEAPKATQQPVQQSAEPPRPTQEELNTPSGDASNAREVVLAPRPNIAIKGESTWDDGYTALLGAFKALRTEARRLGLASVGPPQTVFLHTDDAGFKFEAFLVLEKDPAGSPKPQKNMAFSTSPAGRAFVFQHVGAYDDIDSTYEAITAWLDEKGLTSKGAFVEEYLNEPEGSDDALLKLNIYVFIE